MIQPEEIEKTSEKMMKHDDYNDFRSEATNHRGGGGLPRDIIIYDILTRVSTDILIRLRQVCKQWYNLILYDPVFIDLHSRRSCKPPQFIIFQYADESDILRYPQPVLFDLSKKIEKKILSPLPVAGNYKFIEILYSLNGLLLISCLDRISKMLEYVVCNPITGQFTTLPDLVLVDCQTCHFCLTYDPAIAKYKVVCFIYNTTAEVNFREYYCKIFTLGGVEGGDYSWRENDVPKPHNYYLCFEYNHLPVFANGSLHFKMCTRSSLNLDGTFLFVEPKYQSILKLDVSKETFNIIINPKQDDPNLSYSLLEMGGLLCFVDHISLTRLKLWVLKEEGLEYNHNKKHEWTEEGSIDIGHLLKQVEEEEEESRVPPLAPFQTHCYPIAIVKPKLMFWKFCPSDGSTKYYSYDMELKQVDFICQRSRYLRRPLHWHVNSLTYF